MSFTAKTSSYIRLSAVKDERVIGEARITREQARLFYPKWIQDNPPPSNPLTMSEHEALTDIIFNVEYPESFQIIRDYLQQHNGVFPPTIPRPLPREGLGSAEIGEADLALLERCDSIGIHISCDIIGSLYNASYCLLPLIFLIGANIADKRNIRSREELDEALNDHELL